MTSLPARANLEVSGLAAGYPNSFHIAGVSLSAPAGSVVGFIGPNGGGKSTVLKAITGTITPTAGQVTLGGEPLRKSSGRIAFVPQREEVNWDFPVTALDVVVMGRYRRLGWARWPGRADRAAGSSALSRLGLAGAEGRHISQFSGGQQQRIFLARALVQEPALVVLDEPFTGVDQHNRAIFHSTIRDFASAGVPVLIATHDLDEVIATCSHVALINDGLIAFGPTEETYTPENLRQTFGGQLAVFT